MGREVAGQALLTAADLDEKTWLILLLVLGAPSVGVLAMLAYLMVRPDPTGLSVEWRHPRPEWSVSTLDRLPSR